MAEFVSKPFTKDASFNYGEFRKAIHIAIKALDELIDENYQRHALKAQQEMSFNYRNIGLGIMGYADMLIKLGMTYGSMEAIEFTDQFFFHMFREAVMASSELASQKGSFPKYDERVWESTIIKEHFSEQEIEKLKEKGLRNCSLLSIAPTGTLSTFLNCGGGIEPLFAISHKRKTMMDNGEEQIYDIFCGVAEQYIEKIGGKELPEYFVGSADISWEDRLLTQGTIQKHIDTGISSTINLPEETKIEDIEQLYYKAWKYGLKGVTTFRDGCKRLGILTTKEQEKNAKPIETNELQRGEIIKAGNDCIGLKRIITSGCGSLHTQAFFDSTTGELREIYLSKGSSGGCQNFMIGLSRMISLSARGGVSAEDIVDQLFSCGVCPSYAVRRATKHDTSKGSSCPVAIGYALQDMTLEMKQRIADYAHQKLSEKTQKSQSNDNPKCPDCGEDIVFEGGCNICKSCGWSKCD